MTRHKRKLLKMRRRREERKRAAPSQALLQLFNLACNSAPWRGDRTLFAMEREIYERIECEAREVKQQTR